MDRLEQLKHENEKLAVDSVALDKIIDVVDELSGLAMFTDFHAAFDAIAKIIKERDDAHDDVEPMGGATAFAQAFRPKDRRHQQDIPDETADEVRTNGIR